MIKLLILAYDFPPYVSVGGLRPYSWYKYLHLYDIYPIVITRQWENKYKNHLDYISPGYSSKAVIDESSEGTLISSPFKPTTAHRILLKYGDTRFQIIRKIINLFNEFFQYPLQLGSKITIYRAADEYLQRHKVDCIIATGDPFILFKYASKLSKKYSIPWIADYRDAWVQDRSSKGRNYYQFYKIWSAFFEKKILSNVASITTVSTFIQKQIEQNIEGKNFEIVYNGYDPKIVELTEDIKQQGKTLSIALAGTIYDWHPIESFLRVCNEILNADPNFDLELHFYGINDPVAYEKMILQNYQQLSDRTFFHSKMPNLELVKKIARHNVLLLFNYYSMLGTKIFDYLAIKRKIILCYENDAEALELKKKFYCVDEIESESSRLQAEVIEATNSGIVVRDAKHLKEVLYELYSELQTNGFIASSSTNTENYSRLKQAEQLASVIKKTVGLKE